MEARAALADYDAARSHWTLSTNTQGSWLVRNILAEQHLQRADRTSSASSRPMSAAASA